MRNLSIYSGAINLKWCARSVDKYNQHGRRMWWRKIEIHTDKHTQVEGNVNYEFRPRIGWNTSQQQQQCSISSRTNFYATHSLILSLVIVRTFARDIFCASFFHGTSTFCACRFLFCHSFKVHDTNFFFVRSLFHSYSFFYFYLPPPHTKRSLSNVSFRHLLSDNFSIFWGRVGCLPMSTTFNIFPFVSTVLLLLISRLLFYRRLVFV